MPGLSAWAVRRPVIALVSWLVALVVVVGLGTQAGGELNDSFDLPDTESKVATDLLSASGTDTSRLDGGATIVWSPATGTAVDPAVAAQIVPLLTEVAALESVACVTNPLDPQGAALGTACPEASGPDPAAMQTLTPEEQQILAASFSSISPDQTVAYATVSFVTDANGELSVSTADAKAILDGVKALNGEELAVGAQGQVLDFAGQEPPSSEAIGLLVAIIILLIAFGSIVAAGMPIVVALVGLTMGQMFVLVVANFLDVATFAPDPGGHDRPRRRHRLRPVRHEPLPAGRAARAGAQGCRHGGRADGGPCRPVRGQHRHHRAARPVRARHQLLQRPCRRRCGDRAHGDAVGAVDAAGPPQPARRQGAGLAPAVGQEAGSAQGPSRGARVGALRSIPAEAADHPGAAGARGRDRPRHPDAQPAPGLRGRLRQARGLAGAHRLRPARRGLRSRA